MIIIRNVSWAAYYYDFWRSCDTEDWSNDAENTDLITEINYILIYIQIENSCFKEYFTISLPSLYFGSNKSRLGETSVHNRLSGLKVTGEDETHGWVTSGRFPCGWSPLDPFRWRRPRAPHTSCWAPGSPEPLERHRINPVISELLLNDYNSSIFSS